MEEWSGIQETLYLQSIPGMVESIGAAAAEPLEDGVDASEVDFDPDDVLTDEDIADIKKAREEFARGEYTRHEDVNWD